MSNPNSPHYFAERFIEKIQDNVSVWNSYGGELPCLEEELRKVEADKSTVVANAAQELRGRWVPNIDEVADDVLPQEVGSLFVKEDILWQAIKRLNAVQNGKDSPLFPPDSVRIHIKEAGPSVRRIVMSPLWVVRLGYEDAKPKKMHPAQPGSVFHGAVIKSSVKPELGGEIIVGKKLKSGNAGIVLGIRYLRGLVDPDTAEPRVTIEQE